MYTAYIGRRLLDEYNTHRRDGPPLSPRDFFDEVIFPLFFDDEVFLMWVNNSAFDQKYKQKKKNPLTDEVRREALELFHADAEKLSEPHMHLYLGGIARSIQASTSGQVTALDIVVDADEVYCSWIGTAASIGVSSGLSLLIDEAEVLLALFDGWAMYRRAIGETPGMVGHQIETWNGWWLCHRFGPDYDVRHPLRDFDLDPKLKKSGANWRLGTQDWVKVLFALARQFPQQRITAYIFTLGNTNQTVGFRQVRLPEVQAFVDLYLHLFGEKDGIDDPAKLADLYRTEYGFRVVCRQGAIGLRALEPAKLRDYIPRQRTTQKLKVPKPPKKDAQRLTYHLYQTWIIAMLNNKDLISVAEETARVLRAHATSGTKARSTAKRRAEQALDATSRRAFIEQLTEVVQNEEAEARQHLNTLVDTVVAMPGSDFPLLLTLIRFKYHAQA